MNQGSEAVKQEKQGIIIVAYQGMGKTTLTKNNPNYFDLESSEYPRLDPHWFKNYVNDAIHKVTYEGYDICFVSSHKVVRDYLTEVAYPQWLIFYPINGKEEYSAKLAKRYFEDKSIKNASALANCVLDFHNNINEFRAYGNSIGAPTGFIDNDLLNNIIQMSVNQRINVFKVISETKVAKLEQAKEMLAQITKLKKPGEVN